MLDHFKPYNSGYSGSFHRQLTLYTLQRVENNRPRTPRCLSSTASMLN